MTFFFVAKEHQSKDWGPYGLHPLNVWLFCNRRLKVNRDCHSLILNVSKTAFNIFHFVVCLQICTGMQVIGVVIAYAEQYSTNGGNQDVLMFAYNVQDIGWHLFFVQESTNWIVYFIKMRPFRDEFMHIVFRKPKPSRNQTSGAVSMTSITSKSWIKKLWREIKVTLVELTLRCTKEQLLHVKLCSYYWYGLE